MSYLLLIIYLLALSFIIWKAPFFQTKHFSSKIVLCIFYIKFLAGVSVYLVYAYYYDARASSDIFKYFDDGNIIFSALSQNPVDYLRMVTGIGADSPHLIKYYDTCSFWLKDFNYGLFNDNRTVIRFNALVRLISMGNIHIHTLFMSFLSFSGLWALYKVFIPHFNKQKYLLVLVLFFMPSVIFWSSGLLKEGILMFAFGFLIYFFQKLLQQFKASYLLGTLLSVLILLISKFYVLLAALPGLVFIIVIKRTGKKWFFYKLAAIHLLLVAMFWFSQPITGYNLPHILAKKQNDFINYTHSLKKVGSQVELERLQPTMVSIIKNTPEALINSFFRPTLFEAQGATMLMAAIENALLTLALALMIVFYTPHNVKNPMLWFSISFVIILFTLSGLTTPVLGALVRYKAPALPFLGLTLMYLINFDKIEQHLKKLRIWQK